MTVWAVVRGRLGVGRSNASICGTDHHTKMLYSYVDHVAKKSPNQLASCASVTSYFHCNGKIWPG